jgi:membrane protease subunit (stomatin/prohibitin family)
MPFVRRRPLLRAAVVGGGAYMAGKHMANAQADQQYQDASREQQQAQQVQQAPVPAPRAAGPSMADQLNQLADLHNQGLLSEDEFAAAKAKLLGG